MKLTPDKTSQLESELMRIRNVSYASIVLDADGRVDNVDVVSDTERKPQSVVRDAEAILRKNQVKVDHRKIGVVQMVSAPRLAARPARDEAPASAARPGTASDPAPMPLASPQPDIDPQETAAAPPVRPAVLEIVKERDRIRLGAVHSTTSGGSFTAEVELVMGAFEGAPGRADGPANDSSVEIVVQACLEAVRNLLKPGYEIHLRATSFHEVGGLPTVTVVADFGKDRQLTRLVGSCLQKGSLYETAVYACLDALNRSLGRAEFRQLMVQEPGGLDEPLAWRAASA